MTKANTPLPGSHVAALRNSVSNFSELTASIYGSLPAAEIPGALDGVLKCPIDTRAAVAANWSAAMQRWAQKGLLPPPVDRQKTQYNHANVLVSSPPAGAMAMATWIASTGDVSDAAWSWLCSAPPDVVVSIAGSKEVWAALALAGNIDHAARMLALSQAIHPSPEALVAAMATTESEPFAQWLLEVAEPLIDRAAPVATFTIDVPSTEAMLAGLGPTQTAAQFAAMALEARGRPQPNIGLFVATQAITSQRLSSEIPALRVLFEKSSRNSGIDAIIDSFLDVPDDAVAHTLNVMAKSLPADAILAVVMSMTASDKRQGSDFLHWNALLDVPCIAAAAEMKSLRGFADIPYPPSLNRIAASAASAAADPVAVLNRIAPSTEPSKVAQMDALLTEVLAALSDADALRFSNENQNWPTCQHVILRASQTTQPPPATRHRV